MFLYNIKYIPNMAKDIQKRKRSFKVCPIGEIYFFPHFIPLISDNAII